MEPKYKPGDAVLREGTNERLTVVSSRVDHITLTMNTPSTHAYKLKRPDGGFYLWVMESQLSNYEAKP